MVQLVDLTPQLVPSVLDDLLWDDDRPEERAKWERVFNYAWRTAEMPCGYALVDGGKVVGYQGTVCSERVIDGKTHRFCNLHSWVVDEAYRGQSLALMRPVLRMRDHTLTDMAPSRNVYQLLQRFGFSPLDPTVVFLPRCRRTRDTATRELEVITSSSTLRQLLPDAKWQLVEDHRDNDCRFVQFFDGNESCLMGHTVVRETWLSYCYVQYCDNLKFLERYQGQVRSCLLGEHRAWFVAMDSRSARQIELRNRYEFPCQARKLFKSEALQPEQIDNLYTDLAMTGVSGLPSLSNAVRRQLARLLPSSFERTKASNHAGPSVAS